MYCLTIPRYFLVKHYVYSELKSSVGHCWKGLKGRWKITWKIIKLFELNQNKRLVSYLFTSICMQHFNFIVLIAKETKCLLLIVSEIFLIEQRIGIDKQIYIIQSSALCQPSQIMEYKQKLSNLQLLKVSTTSCSFFLNYKKSD